MVNYHEKTHHLGEYVVVVFYSKHQIWDFESNVWGQIYSRDHSQAAFLSPQSVLENKLREFDEFRSAGKNLHPRKPHGTQNGGLEDDFPFQRDDFHVPC